MLDNHYQHRFDVSPPMFAHRLNQYLIELCHAVYSDRGQSFNDGHIEGVELSQTTQFFLLQFSEPKTKRLKRENEDYYFEITPLTDNRLDFQARCKNPAVSGPFNDLIRNIEADFPPAAGAADFDLPTATVETDEGRFSMVKLQLEYEKVRLAYQELAEFRIHLAGKIGGQESSNLLQGIQMALNQSEEMVQVDFKFRDKKRIDYPMWHKIEDQIRRIYSASDQEKAELLDIGRQLFIQYKDSITAYNRALIEPKMNLEPEIDLERRDGFKSILNHFWSYLFERDKPLVLKDDVVSFDLPQKPETLQKWKKAYDIICQTRKNFQDAYGEGQTDDPTPKMADFRDALKAEPITYSEKTIRKIIKVGDAGLLK